MAVAKSDLKFYLTALEPGVAQSDASRSIGGHVSTTVFSQRTTTSAVVSQSDTAVSLSAALSGPRFLVGTEIIDMNGGNIDARGDLDTLQLPHPSGAPVVILPQNSLFNDSFSDDLTQYRCVAVRNENDTDSFYDVKFYLKKTSRNSNSTVSLAVEYAMQEVVTGTATRGGSISLTDTSLIDAYEDNYFSTCSVTFTSGDNINLTRIVSTFDSATGTLVFTNSLTVPVEIGDDYRISQLPSQRVASGKIAPTELDNLSDFYDDETDISIDVDSNRDSGTTLGPWETVYLWLKREGTDNAAEFPDNRVIFTARYKTS